MSTSKGNKGKEPIRVYKNTNFLTDEIQIANLKKSESDEIAILDSEILDFDEVEYILREGTKAELREKFKEGDFNEIKKHINDYGKYKWSNSEAEYFSDTVWDYQSVRYLIDNFDLPKITFDKIYINALIVKEEKAIISLRAANKISSYLKENYVIVTNDEEIIKETLAISEPTLSYHENSKYCIISKEQLIKFKLAVPVDKITLVEFYNLQIPEIGNS